LNSTIDEICGQNTVESVRLENVKTKEKYEVNINGIFIYVGYEPQTELVRDLVKCDENFYILSAPDMSTSLDGFFAAGDVVKKPYRQIVTAASDGCAAALSVDRFLSHKGL
jgi:thioredoxin reductase (NADPH)